MTQRTHCYCTTLHDYCFSNSEDPWAAEPPSAAAFSPGTSPVSGSSPRTALRSSSATSGLDQYRKCAESAERYWLDSVDSC